MCNQSIAFQESAESVPDGFKYDFAMLSFIFTYLQSCSNRKNNKKILKLTKSIKSHFYRQNHQMENTNVIVIWGIPSNVSHDMIKERFSRYGNIISIRSQFYWDTDWKIEYKRVASAEIAHKFEHRKPWVEDSSDNLEDIMTVFIEKQAPVIQSKENWLKYDDDVFILEKSN
jgi:hypothetical protein